MSEARVVYDMELWTVTFTDSHGRPLVRELLMGFSATGPEEYVQIDAETAKGSHNIIGLYKLYWKQDKMREALYRRLEEVKPITDTVPAVT